ncbi:MAG: hypothetical protein V1837_07725 [Candidatus Woesearchaeota archaeon]
MQDCVFCGPRPDLEMYLAKGNLFYTIPKGQICAGHTLMVTTEHLKCYASLDVSAENEYYERKQNLSDILTRHFGNLFMIEYGVWGQTVKHAHKHFIPLEGPKHKVESVFEEMVSPGNILAEVADRARLRHVFGQEKGYVWLEEHGVSRIIHTLGIPDDRTCKHLLYRHFFAVVKGVGVLTWGKMTEEQKREDENNREETRKVLMSVKL